MLLRLLLIAALVIFFTVPIYHLLMRKTVRVKRELESQDDFMDLAGRADELKTKNKQLKADTAEELKALEKKQKSVRKVQKQIKSK